VSQAVADQAHHRTLRSRPARSTPPMWGRRSPRCSSHHSPRRGRSAEIATTFAIAYLIVRRRCTSCSTPSQDEATGALACRAPHPARVLLSVLLLVAARPVGRSGEAPLLGGAPRSTYLGPLIGHMRGWRLRRTFRRTLGQIVLIRARRVSRRIASVSRTRTRPGLRHGSDPGISVVRACGVVLRLARVRPRPDSRGNRSAPRRPRSRTSTRTSTSPWWAASFCSPRSRDRAATTPQGGGGRAAFGLVGGIALSSWPTVALGCAIRGGLGRGRPIAALVLLALLPVATHVAAAGALAMVRRGLRGPDRL